MADAKYKYDGDGPAPGSPEAQEAGCKCPVLDNARGYGHMGMGAKIGWWQSESCPIHGARVVEKLAGA